MRTPGRFIAIALVALLIGGLGTFTPNPALAASPSPETSPAPASPAPSKPAPIPSPTPAASPAPSSQPTPDPTATTVPSPSPSPTPEPQPSPTLAPSPIPAEPVEPAPLPTGEPVGPLDPETELVDRRTETSRTFDLGDGRLVTELFSEAVFYRPEPDAPYQPIDVRFRASGEAVLVDRSPVTVRVAAAGDQAGVLRLAGADGFELAWSPLVGGQVLSILGARPVAAGPAADVASVFPDADLRVVARADGANVFLVLERAPLVAAWTFVLDLPAGASLVADGRGGLEVRDADGTVKALVAAPYAVDSTPDALTGSGRTTSALRYQTGTALDGRPTVTVSVDDAAWLRNAVYPVYVDPSTTLVNAGTNTFGDTFVNEGNAGQNYANYQRPDSPYFYEMWLGLSPSDATYRNHALMKFSMSGVAGQVIDAAELKLRPYHAYYDAPEERGVWARLITSDWTETGATWTNKPTWTTTGSKYITCAESTTLSCVFDVKNWVQDWVDSDVDNFGVWLDTNGGGATYWKRLLASEEVHSTTPRLYVTHHDPITLGYPNGGRTGSRTLNWTRDPAWGQTTYQAQVATDSGFTAIVAQSGAVFGSGGTWTIPLEAGLTSGTTYHWRVTAKTVGGAWSSWTEGTFTYDLSLLGSQAQHRYESWDLGAGDSLSVDASTLNALVAHPIVSLPYRGNTLSLGLTYNAQEPDNAGFGRGWRLDMGRRLVVNGTTSVTFIDQTGARHTFTNPVTVGTVTTYTRPPTIYATLVKDTAQAAEFTLTYRGKARDSFDLVGTTAARLVREADRHGNGVDLSYDANANLYRITDPAGRYVELSWDTAATPDRVTQITDWAYVSGGVVQTTSTGARRSQRFFYDATGRLAGWAGPLNTASVCPTTGQTTHTLSHLTCLTYDTAGYLTTLTKAQTYTTFDSSTGTLGTALRPVTTQIDNAGTGEVRNVRDAEQYDGLDPANTFSRTTGLVEVLRQGTPDGTSRYAVPVAADAYGRVTSVKRKLGTTWIEEVTAYGNASFPTESTAVTQNNGALLSTPARTTTYSYLAGSLGLVSRVVEPLSATDDRWTDYVYNANDDVTQQTVSLEGSTTQRTITRHCYDAACATNANGLLLLKTIGNYVDGVAGGANGHVEDVTTSYTYDAYGRVIRETRANYAAGGTLLDARATGFEYDANGSQTKEIANYADGTVAGSGDDIDPNATTNARTDLTTVHTYDTAGNRVSTADPRRAIELAKGTGLNADDYVGRTSFDALNQALTEQAPRSPGDTAAPKSSTTTYDELGAARSITDFGGVATASEYDRAGRTTRTFEDVDGAGAGAAAATSSATYDAAGRAVTAKDRRQVADASLGWTATTYDELGRQVDATEASGSSPDVASTTRRTYDALDRGDTEETGFATGSGQLTDFGYDVGGRTIETDDEFTCATATYDYRDLALTETSGLAGDSCASGAETRTVIHTYDGLGRRTRSEVTAGAGLGDRTADDTLDSAGRRLTAAVRTGGVASTTSFTLNPLDQVVAEARPDGSTAKTNYDPAGNPTDRCYWKPAITVGACLPADTTPWTNPPSVATTSEYDARSQRIELVDPSTGTTTTYDPDHNYQPEGVFVLTGSGAKEHQTRHAYDTRHRLTSVSHQFCAAPATDHSCGSPTATGSSAYAYDDTDNRTQVTETATGSGATTYNYCYDALGRLRARQTTTGCPTTSGDETYTYDDPGNRLTALAGGLTTNQAYSASGQLCDAETGTAASCTLGNVGHDSDGNVNAFNGWTYAYDSEGRLTTAVESGSNDQLAFTYDGEGHRTQIKEYTAGVLSRTRDLRYQGDAVVEEKVTDAAHPSGAIVRTYITDESGRIVKLTVPAGEPGAGTYLVTWNGHGDALAVHRINADGTLTLANSYTYSTWGTPTTATYNAIPDLGFHYLYVGAYGVQWDDFSGLGLHYMSARHYSPRIGRFLQPDPSAAEANAYGYADGNPVTKVDPSGRCPWCIIIIIARAVMIAAPAIAAAARAIAPAVQTAAQRTVPILQRFWSTVHYGARNPILRSPTAYNFRENLSRLTGVRPGYIAQAHHVFPQKFDWFFRSRGINIHNPSYGAWWPSASHQREAYIYNRVWELLIATRPPRSVVLNFGRVISRAFGLRVNY